MAVQKAVSRRLDLPIGPELAGIKVDTLLKKHLGLSGTVVRRIKWLEDGILVDGRRVNTRFVPCPGQVLSVRLSDPERRSGIVPAPGPLDIVYEDGDIIVLNKAPGIPVHPGPGHFSDTIGNFLLHYYDSQGIEADFHPVHRLDRGTSGLLAVAKHPHAQEVLKSQLHTPGFRRVYLAVCEGVPSPAAGVVDAPLGPRPGSLVEQMVRPDGKEARTHYETLGIYGNRALLRLELGTGRTHQIRVHMAYLGHPLTGDFLYGAEAPELIARPALHSAELNLLHPVTGEALTFRVPMPQDMERLCVP
ncbi:RluA family pseudouridine synthase [Pseudoflavonifractor phocaeensis]|uniref:RluA family pseudouridine synthase n=1 Tax=Pseudoflavonifractor phocaeensis TaxID=1870988 RepID=UPI001F4212D2|nr:RluA family pseudouridine synthase [Pseudoflavonifractor phocaeensis]MCF2661933.1 RluA family pseudouridine synthase [Pseudoflavonifractor phocaeensis]